MKNRKQENKFQKIAFQNIQQFIKTRFNDEKIKPTS